MADELFLIHHRPFSSTIIQQYLMGQMMGTKRKAEHKTRLSNRRTAVGLPKLKAGKMHNDGNGLYLDVQRSGSRSCILRSIVRRKRRDIGLGGLSTTSLAQAQEEAAKL